MVEKLTSSLLPCDLRLRETVGFTLDASVGALSKCFVSRLQNPTWWYCITIHKNVNFVALFSSKDFLPNFLQKLNHLSNDFIIISSSL